MISAENESMKIVSQEATESKDEDGDNLQSTITSVFKLPPHLNNASQFRIFVYKVTESKAFGGAILCVIFLNTLMLIAQTREEDLMKRGEMHGIFSNRYQGHN